jgi:hypothetical protein
MTGGEKTSHPPISVTSLTFCSSAITRFLAVNNLVKHHIIQCQSIRNRQKEVNDLLNEIFLVGKRQRCRKYTYHPNINALYYPLNIQLSVTRGDH